jgi:hypothetical protein
MLMSPPERWVFLLQASIPENAIVGGGAFAIPRASSPTNNRTAYDLRRHLRKTPPVISISELSSRAQSLVPQALVAIEGATMSVEMIGHPPADATALFINALRKA